MNMTAADWSLVESVLDRLEDLPGPERPAAVATLCGERPDLVATVENLLRAQDACDEVDFLEEPATVPHEAVDELEPPPPEQLGQFRVGRRIGRGGYGVVYEGLREDVGQRVAIKVLRGAAGSTAHGRFRREQRILALLDHPAVPRLIDAGRAESGEIYFAMELVEGEPITDYVRRTNVGLRERLRLFLEACDAVRYAHSRLVVHRDIKPHNVMVTAGDGPARVKVVDFGIAAPLQPDAERLTGTGPPAPMTIAFAAPEQLRGERAEPATDVYGLGLLLFILLTDRLPYRVPRRSHAAMERTVLEAVIPNPSGVSPHPWSRRLRGDLDHVVQKALAKEAGRRYPTADALQADIRSYLEGLPVSARRPSVAYAAWRAVYRRRTAAVAVLATLLAAGGTYAFGAARQRAAAIRAAEERAVIAEVLADVLESVERLPSRSPATSGLLARATGAVGNRAGHSSAIEAELLAMIADQYDALGQWENALPLFERTVRLESVVRPHRPAHAMALLGLGGALLSQDVYPDQSDFDRVDSLYSLAGHIFRRTLGSRSPSAALVFTHRARLNYMRRDYEGALANAEEATAILRSALRNSTEWDRTYEQVRNRTPPQDWGGGVTSPSRWMRDALWIALTQRGNAELALGKLDRASLSILTAARGLYRTSPFEHNTAMIFTTLGDVLWTQNSPEEAERAYRVSLTLFRRLYGRDSRFEARCLDGITNSRYLAGSLNGALRSALYAASVAQRSGDTLHIAHSLTSLGIIYSDMSQYDEANHYFSGVLDLLDSSASHPDYLSYVVTARSRRSIALAALGQIRRATSEAFLASREAASLPPSRRTSARIALATILAAHGQHSAAIDTLEVTLEQLWEPPVRTNPRMQARRVAQMLSEYHRAVGNTAASQRYERVYLSNTD